MTTPIDTSATPARGHYFVFSTDWREGERLCGECRQTAKEGGHPDPWADLGIKERTSYVCPADGDGLGHRSIYTGSPPLSLRSPLDAFCSCGKRLLEEDTETWRLSWEMRTPLAPEWHRATVIRSRHAAEQQRAGLLALIEQGEPIRDIQLAQLVEASSKVGT